MYIAILYLYIYNIYLHILTMSWNRPPPSQGLRFIFTLRLHREPTNSQTLVSSVTMVLTPAWTKRLKHTLGTTGERCWVLGVDAGKSFLGQGVIPPPHKKYISTSYQHPPKRGDRQVEETTSKNMRNKTDGRSCFRFFTTHIRDFDYGWVLEEGT